MARTAVKRGFAARVTRPGDPGEIPPNGRTGPPNLPRHAVHTVKCLYTGCVSARENLPEGPFATTAASPFDSGE
ncbi:hypothetical protein [Streptomyces sp. NPDC001139]